MRMMSWTLLRAPESGGAPAGGAAPAGGGDGGGPGGRPDSGRMDRPARKAAPPAPAPADAAPAETAEPAAPIAGKPPGKDALTPPGAPAKGQQRARPDWIAEKHWDGETGTVKLKDLATSYREIERKLSMRTEDLRKADAADRKTLLPTGPDKYVPRLHKDYVESAAKAGHKFDAEKAVSFNDPMVRMLAVVAHRHGLDQEAFEDIATFYHHTRMKMAPDPAQERLKLGERGAERAAHVKMQLETRLGREAAAQFIQTAGGPTAFLVDSIERLLTGAGITMPTYTHQGSGEPALDREKLKSLMRDPRYRDKKHPEHDSIVKQVSDGFAFLSGGKPYQPGIAARH